jgi:YesN/AraC family two-component response regulator|tara:strand:+ start:218 stop:499 length:282 start_codon:yes stop_codon:yes gene_type:complete
LEKRIDVLRHRLNEVEKGREHWKTEAGLLEELVDNTHARLDQLKSKLEIAESGPEKLTKKEINFRRAKAEYELAISRNASIHKLSSPNLWKGS